MVKKNLIQILVDDKMLAKINKVRDSQAIKPSTAETVRMLMRMALEIWERDSQ